MIGSIISHYEILEKLGEGGMGVVYKARDTRLDRFVAIKLLPPGRVADPDRKRRFVQEAKAASALNHPHIITIHDIAGGNGADFIVMEYVPGKTLDQLIPRKGLRLNEALKYAVQIAEALAAAHGAGIVHRDLKPGNIMVSEDGRVKVLDFGLAKLAEPSEGGETAETRTIRSEEAPHTAEGKIVGTVAYMSPEQAQGKKVDARSDIFSFGTLLYEMVTGQRPFQGDTNVSMLAAVLKEEPKRAGDVVEGLPKEVERVIIRCLRKDPERRFQYMKDLKVELEELREESASGTLEAAAPVVAKPRRRWIWAVAALGMVVIGAGIWFGLSRRGPGEVAPTATGAPMKIVPVTSYPGNERSPSFSPDGKQVAFEWNGEKQDNWDIYVKYVDGGTPLRLTTGPAVDRGPAWSPDGRSIAFSRRSENGEAIYSVSPLGGSERKLTDVIRGASGQLSWSPDGRLLAFDDREESPSGPPSIFVLSLETGEKRRLTPVSQEPQWGPAFSPDGSTLAFLSGRGPGGGASPDIYLMPVGGGKARRLTLDGARIRGLAWTLDGREIVFSSLRAGEMSLWKIPVSGGTPVAVAGPGTGARFPTISGQGDRLLYTSAVMDTNIWRMDVRGEGSPEKFIESTRLDENPQYSPDGKRIVFASSRSGNYELWVCNSDGSNPVQLSSFGGSMNGGFPSWSPDGKQVAFDSSLKGNFDIYVVNADGGVPRQLTTDGSTDARPSWSRDGNSIYFQSDRSGTLQIWEMPAGGGTPLQVTKQGGDTPVVSPDGKFVYYAKLTGKPGVWRIPTEGGEETPVLKELPNAGWGHWAPVENGIYFAKGDSNGSFLNFLSFETGHVRQIVRLEKPWTVPSALSISPDRRWFLYSQIDQVSEDLMMLENFR